MMMMMMMMTNLHLILLRFPVIAQRRSIVQIIAFDRGVALVNAFVVGKLCEYRIKS